MSKFKAYQYFVIVMLACLPSLYLLLRYPPFFNQTDSLVYFDYPLPIPHYPVFYPLYCHAFLLFFHGSVLTLYGILIVQHIFYCLAVIYMTWYFKSGKARVLFLLLMFFAFRASFFVHGIYTESWAIIATGFIMGALLRICFNRGNNIRIHYFIYFLSFALLLLTRFAGLFLVFVLPVYLILKSIQDKNMRSPETFRLIARQLLLTAGIIAVVQLTTTVTLRHYDKPGLSVYGRPGTYRINSALDPANTWRNTKQVLATYKASTNDTLVKRTFDVLADSGVICWAGAYQQVDSLKVELAGKGLISKPVSTDEYLNSAFKIYLFHPGCYPFASILRDFTSLYINVGLLTDQVSYSVHFVQKDFLLFRASMMGARRYIEDHIFIDDYLKIYTDPLLFLSGFLVSGILILIFIPIKRKLKIPADLTRLFWSVVITVTFCHLLVTLLTINIGRYAQPAEFMLYTMFCVAVAAGKFESEKP